MRSITILGDPLVLARLSRLEGQFGVSDDGESYEALLFILRSDKKNSMEEKPQLIIKVRSRRTQLQLDVIVS